MLDESSGKLTIRYLYSLDGRTWNELGGQQGPFGYDWSLSHFKGYRIGLFNYAKAVTGGYVDFDYYSLSDVLSADGKAVSTDRLQAAIAETKSLRQDEYPAEDWAELQTLLKKAETALVSNPSTQNEVDAPQRALSVQLAQLAVDREESTSPTPDPGDGDQDKDDAGKDDAGKDDQDGHRQPSHRLPSTGVAVLGLSGALTVLAVAGVGLTIWRKRNI